MFHYFLEVSIAWLLLLIVYYSFLRKETFFKTNRWYLMHSLMLGLLLPMLRHIPISWSNEVSSTMPIEFINLNTYKISQVMETTPTTGFDWDYRNVLLTIYALGVVILSFRMFYGLLKIYSLWYNAEKVKKGDFTLVVTEKGQLPFSFFKFVFISKSFLNKKYIQTVLEHELAHIKHRHTYDVFAVQILSIIFWWNPLIYMFKKALKETHEYLADAYATLDNDIKNYGHILLGYGSSGIELALTNQFFNSLLKKRILMMHQKKSAGYKFSKYLLAIPLLCFMVVLFSSNSIIDADDKALLNEYFYENSLSENETSNLNIAEEGNVKEALLEAFTLLYSKSQVYGKVRNESQSFFKLYKKYLPKYKSEQKLKEDFIEIACSFGVKVIFAEEKDRVREFKTFMYVVPKSNFNAWKAGEMPSYDEMVCGPNSMTPPPPPPVNKNLKADNIHNILANHKSISNLVNDKTFTSTHTFNSNTDGDQELTNVSFSKRDQSMEKSEKDIIEMVSDFTSENNFVLADGDILTANNVYILNGQEITFEDGSIVTLEGKMHTSFGAEANKKYGKVGKNIVHVLEGKIINHIVKGNQESEYKVEIIVNPIFEKPIHEMSEVNRFIENGAIINIDGKDSTIGELKTLNHENVKDLNAISGKEAIVKFGKKGEHGVLEIMTKGHEIPAFQVEEVPEEEVSIKSAKRPLFIIDGVRVPENRVGNLDPKDIKTVNVIKDEGAKEYGEAGKNGVVMITTKNGNYKLPVVVIDSDLNLDETKPLLILDGEVSTDQIISEIDPDDIAEMKVFKGEKAFNKYGEAGNNGVVEIMTKSHLAGLKVLTIVDGEKVERGSDQLNTENSFTTSEFAGAKYSMSSDIAKEKIDIDDYKGQVDFRFTKSNHELESKMPIKFELINNPVINNRVEFEYKIERLDRIEASIIDMSGALIKNIEFTPQNNIGTSSVDMDGIVKGMYLLRLKQANSSVVNRIILP